MSEPIDRLELEISASSGQAEQGLDGLINALSRLKSGSRGANDEVAALSSGLRSFVEQTAKLKSIGESFKVLSNDGKALSNLKNIKLPTKFAEQLEQIKKAVQGYQTVHEGLESISTSLERIGKLGDVKISGTIAKRITEISNAVKGVDDAAIQKLDSMTASLERLAGVDVKGLPSAIRALNSAKKIAKPDSVAPLSTQQLLRAGDTGNYSVGIRDDGDVSDRADKIKETGNAAADASKKIKEYKYTLRDLGKAASDAVDKGINKLTSGIKKFAKSAVKDFVSPVTRSIAAFNKWKSAIGRVAFYRAVRTAIKMVTDGLKEGVNNLYYYSQLAGTAFAPAMDRLATSALYLKNSFGAMAAPLIQAVAPAIDFLIDKFVALINVINMAFAALSGQKTYTRAIRQAASFGDGLARSMGDAADSAKEFKRYLIGIDELTIIPDQNSGSGGGGGGGAGGADYGSMFEEVELPQKFTDWAKEIRDAIDSGDWYGAGEILAEKLNGLMDTVNAEQWGNKLGETIQKGISFALGFIRTLNWQGAGEGLAGFVNGLFDRIVPEDVGALLASKIRIAVDFAYGFVTKFKWNDFGEWLGGVVNGWIEEIDWKLLGETIGGAILGALRSAAAFLDKVNWGDLGKGLADSLSNIQWDEILSTGWETFKKAIKDLGDFVTSFIGNLEGVPDTLAKIAAGFAAIKVSKSIGTLLDKLSKFKLGTWFEALGMLGAAGIALKDFWDVIKDFAANGASFDNVTAMISDFSGVVGMLSAFKGNEKFGGFLELVYGIGNVLRAIEDLTTGEVNFDTAEKAIRGVGGIITAIGFISGAKIPTGLGLVLTGIPSLIEGIGSVWDAIQSGDWSSIDYESLILAVTTSTVGISKIISAVSDIGQQAKNAQIAKEAVDEAKTSMSGVTGSFGTADSGSGLFGVLKGLAKNLGIGIVIIGEVAAAAGLIIGAVWGLGELLKQVGDAWQPVIENGDTVVTAIGIGTGILAAIGVATYALGSAGGTFAANIGIGTAILGEIGIATGLFIAEIWAIGEGLNLINDAWQPVFKNGESIATAIGIGTGILVGIGVVTGLLGVATVATSGTIPLAIGVGTAMLVELGIAAAAFITEIWGIGTGLDEIGKAWEPVLNNGDTIAKGIKTGTGFLVGIGVASAALGVAAVASVGLLPLAIAAGTGMLEQLSDATVKFTDSLADVADEMTDKLAPALADFNAVLPSLSSNMSRFKDYMTDFAEYVVQYSKEQAVASLSATIDTIVGWFTRDPLDKLRSDVEKNYDQTVKLNKKLDVAVPELQEAQTSLSNYFKFMSLIQETTSGKDFSGIPDAVFADMEAVGQKLVTGFKQGITSEGGLGAPALESLNEMKSQLEAYDWTGLGSGIGKKIVSGLKNAGTEFNRILDLISGNGSEMSLPISVNLSKGKIDKDAEEYYEFASSNKKKNATIKVLLEKGWTGKVESLLGIDKLTANATNFTHNGMVTPVIEVTANGTKYRNSVSDSTLVPVTADGTLWRNDLGIPTVPTEAQLSSWTNHLGIPWADTEAQLSTWSNHLGIPWAETEAYLSTWSNHLNTPWAETEAYLNTWSNHLGTPWADIEAHLTTWSNYLGIPSVSAEALFNSWDTGRSLGTPSIGSNANFTSWRNNIGTPSFNAQANFSSYKRSFATPTFDVKGNLTSIHVPGGTHYFANGGILKGNKWQPIEGYARGGAIKTARLFYANENGMPELVGRIGSNTAVMNNGQIVSSVASGVYQAVSAAFGQLGGYFGSISNSISRIPAAIGSIVFANDTQELVYPTHPEIHISAGSVNRTEPGDEGQNAISGSVRMGNEELINAVYAAAARIITAIAENGTVELDGETISTNTTERQNRSSRMYGAPVTVR